LRALPRLSSAQSPSLVAASTAPDARHRPVLC